MPDADRWAIVERIYHEAVERPVDGAQCVPRFGLRRR